MNKLKRKAVYEAPLTEFFQVELEGVFCGSVGLENKKGNSVTIDDHGINNEFNAEFNAEYSSNNSNWEF